MTADQTQPRGNPNSVVKLLRERLRSSDLILPVTGSSMRGVIESGTTVTITAAERPRVGEVWAFAADDGRLIVHRIRHIGTDFVTPRGVGNLVDDAPVSRSRLIGKVTHSHRSGTDRRFGILDRITAGVVFRIRTAARSVGLTKRMTG